MINKIFNKLGSIFRKSDRKEIPVKHKVETKVTQTKPSRPPKKRSPNRTSKPVDHKPQWNINKFVVPEKEGESRFHELDLPVSIMHAIADLGFKYCTPIQAKLLPPTLKGKDAIGKAQTGTGKTAAFLISIFTRILRRRISNRKAGFPRALILAPTRELVMQIEKDAVNLAKYTKIKTLAVYGGMDYKKQKNRLRSQVVDILVATPGRLLDFKKNGDVNLSSVEILVIDEADRMLDMGFIPDVRTIVRSTPYKDKRQTLFFSATISGDVERLSASWTTDSVKVEIEPENIAAESVDQQIYIVTSDEKFSLLYNIISKNNLKRVMVFCNRKDEASRVYERLYSHGLNSQQISGDIDQRKRIRTLEEFKTGKINILVATDVAGRGIHVDDVSHVINYSLPENPEDYVHRIGRTGRAGASGISVGFATEDDSFNIPSIEKLLDKKLECIHPDDDLLKDPPPAVRKFEKQKPQKKQYRPKQNGDRKKNYRPRQGGDRKKTSGQVNKKK